MQVNSVNNVSNQNFRGLMLGTQARQYIKEQAMNPRNKQEWRPFVEELKSAQKALKGQKWGDVMVTLKEGITDNGTKNFNIVTALFAPVLVGRCIENHWVTKTELNADKVICREEIGCPVDSSKEVATEEWESINKAIYIAEKHERYAEEENKHVLMQQQKDDEYCAEMKNSLNELGIE